MTLPYLLRLLSLCLASFFIVQFLLGLLVAAIAPWAVRRAERMYPSRGAASLFALRLAPLVCASSAVILFAVPSYLLLEPSRNDEPVSIFCLVVTLLGAATCATSLWRGIRAQLASVAYLRNCLLNGRELELPSSAGRILMVENASGFALAGLLCPRLIVSRDAWQNLTAEQIHAVVRHERAHQHARDNLKRLFIALAPRILFLRGPFHNLERAWAQLAEWSADDEATATSSNDAVALAEALVEVARFHNAARPALVTALVAESSEVGRRVDRLLYQQPLKNGGNQPLPKKAVCALFLAASALLCINGDTLKIVHLLLERLMH